MVMSMYDRFHEIFDGDGGDYTFTASHVAISGHDVKCEIAADGTGEWILTQTIEPVIWTARHRNKTAAVLLLIAARMGLTGELREVHEDDA